MRDIVKFEKVPSFLGDQMKYQAVVRLPFGWTFEAVFHIHGRWRLLVIGGGLHCGEPWGEDGPLWALNVRVYAFGLSLGVRGPAQQMPESVEPDEWDTPESPDAP